MASIYSDDRPAKDTSSVERRLMHLYNTVNPAQHSDDNNDDTNDTNKSSTSTPSTSTSDKPHVDYNKDRLFPTEAEVLQMKRDIHSSESPPLSESEEQSFGRISELDADTKQKIWGKLVSVHGIDLSEWKDAFIS